MMKQEPGMREELEALQVLTQHEEALTITTSYLEDAVTSLSQDRGREIMASMSGRVKTAESIIRKLLRKGHAVGAKEALEYLNDIAGIRLICDYTDDIYAIRDALYRWNDAVIIKEKDFIKKPKKSGYRSLHIVISLPLPSTDYEESVRVEIQLRTVIMDFWARLYHRTQYKQELDEEPELLHELHKCAVLGKRMDAKMLRARVAMEEKKLPEKTDDNSL